MFDCMINCCNLSAQYGYAAKQCFYIVRGMLDPTHAVNDYDGDGLVTTTQDLFSDLHARNPSIRKHIFINKAPIQGIKACGNNFGDLTVIFIDQKLINQTSIESLGWFLKHEISHIHNNDRFKSSLYGAITSLITGLAVPIIAPFMHPCVVPFLYCLPSGVGITVKQLNHIIADIRADAFALKESHDGELEQALFFLEAGIEANKELHPEFPDYCTAAGNLTCWVDAIHPTHTTRVEKISSELRRRKVTPKEINAEETRGAVEYFKQCIAATKKIKID